MQKCTRQNHPSFDEFFTVSQQELLLRLPSMMKDSSCNFYTNRLTYYDFFSTINILGSIVKSVWKKNYSYVNWVVAFFFNHYRLETSVRYMNLGGYWLGAESWKNSLLLRWFQYLAFAFNLSYTLLGNFVESLLLVNLLFQFDVIIIV